MSCCENASRLKRPNTTTVPIRIDDALDKVIRSGMRVLWDFLREPASVTVT